MRFSSWSTAALAAGGTVVSAALPSAAKPNVTYIPDTYIVELEQQDASITPSAHLTQNGKGLSYRVRHEYTNPKYFYGLSLTLDPDTNQSSLQDAVGVKNVWRVSIQPRPQVMFAAPPAGNVSIPHITGTSDVNRPLKMGQVDKLHTLGIKGKGVKVAIIDSGVDYKHPSLGGGFGPGFKVGFGTDLVGDDYNGGNQPQPDSDPLVTCASGGHGTHVSGIVGMQDPTNKGFGLVGVAPEATMGMYRVFGCEGGSADDVIIAGMQQAAEDGADLISMSLGGTTYWEAGSPYGTLVGNIVNTGVAVIAAAGNDGQLGPFAVSAPSLAPAALSVGSIENEVYPTVYTATTSHNDSIEYITTLPVIEKEPIDMYLLGSGLGVPITGVVADGCDNDAWTAAQKAIKSPNTTAVMILEDNQCSIGVYQTALEAIGVTRIPGTTAEFTVITLDYPNSQKLVKDVSGLKKGQSLTLAFKNSTVQDAVDPAGNAIDFFSTIGPTVEGTLKPQLSAPGGNILSTWVTSAGGYAVISGTSMATPYAAGCYALLKSQRPDLSPAKLISLLQSTSVPLKAQNLKLLSSVAQQGGGIIDAYAAVMADSQITPSQLSLRDSATPASQKITIENTSKSPKTYTISHEGASWIQLFNNFTSGQVSVFLSYELLHEAKYAGAQFSKTSFTLQSLSSASFTVQFTPPKDFNAVAQPLYSGFVKIVTGNSSYSVPYLGTPYSRHDAQLLDTDTKAAMGFAYPDVTNTAIKQGETTVETFLDRFINGSYPKNWKPALITQFVSQPCNYMRMDAVPVNTAFVPDIYGFDRNVTVKAQNPDMPLVPGFLGVPTYGAIVEFGIGRVPSTVNVNGVSAWPFPYILDTFGFDYPELLYNNGSTYFIKSGDYRPLIRALRYGGNGTDPKEYQSWLGPVMRINVPG